MRVVAWIGLLALCLGLAGCRLFGKKSATAANPADRPPTAAAGPVRLDPPTGAAAGGSAPPAGVDGLLAGRVIDSYGSKPPRTSIRVIALDEAKDAQAAPIDYETDAQGYFTIYSLRAGQHYKLVARAPDGDRVLAGISYVIPPDPKVIIRISEDFASPNTPPVPPQPTLPGSKPPPGKDAVKPPAATRSQGPVDLGAPKASTGPATTQPATARPTRPEDVVDHGNALARNGPVADVANPYAGIKVQPPSPGPAPSGNTAPFCTVGADRGVNFILNDLDGRPWEFATRPHGRVVLLDFWASWCGPCVHAIPELVHFEEAYGSWGLDIIGIAYEDGTPEEQSRKVRGVRDRLGINYHLLLGGNAQSCPVKTQLGVEAFPTLVLLDEKGHVLGKWQGLTAENKRDLEYRIRWYLNTLH